MSIAEPARWKGGTSTRLSGAERLTGDKDWTSGLVRPAAVLLLLVLSGCIDVPKEDRPRRMDRVKILEYEASEFGSGLTIFELDGHKYLRFRGGLTHKADCENPRHSQEVEK